MIKNQVVSTNTYRKGVFLVYHRQKYFSISFVSIPLVLVIIR